MLFRTFVDMYVYAHHEISDKIYVYGISRYRGHSLIFKEIVKQQKEGHRDKTMLKIELT